MLAPHLGGHENSFKNPGCAHVHSNNTQTVFFFEFGAFFPSNVVHLCFLFFWSLLSGSCLNFSGEFRIQI